MFAKSTLLIVGMLAAGSVSTLAGQSAAPPSKPATQQRVSAPARPMPHVWTVAQVREAQADLAGLHLYAGKVTGTMNTATQQALRTFQREHRLPVTGQLSDSTLAALRAAKPAPAGTGKP